MQDNSLCNTKQLLKMLDDKTENVNDDFTKSTEKESNKKSLTDITKASGIYKIVNKVDGKYYVGSSQNINRRWQKHKCQLKNNQHWNKHLQNVYNKYGIDNFDYTIIEIVEDVKELLSIEQKYLNECKNNPDNNYMISFDAVAPMRGRKCTWGYKKGTIPWNKGLIGVGGRKKGFFVSNETKIKLKALAEKQFSEDGLEKHRQLCKTPEHRTKITQGKIDKTIFRFQHTETSEIFTGLKYDWYMKYFGKAPCNLPAFIRGERKKLLGWILLNHSTAANL